MEGGVSGVFRILGGTKEVCYIEKDIITISTSLDDLGCPFDIIGSFWILFYLILFSTIICHNDALRLLYYGHVDT